MDTATPNVFEWKFAGLFSSASTGTSSREKTSATESGDVDANSAETEATPLKDDNEDQQRSL